MNNNISRLRYMSAIGILLHHVICAFYGCSGGIRVGSVLPIIFSDGTDIVRRVSMASFTFISGYVLYYQTNKKETYMQFLKKKCMRILLPYIFYSCAYMLLFPEFINEGNPIIGTHLWYLPMLFVLILLTSVHFLTKYASIIIFILYLCIKTSPTNIIIAPFDRMIVYLPVFYIGFLFNMLRVENKEDTKMLLYGIAIVFVWIALLRINVPHTEIMQMCIIPIGLYMFIAGMTGNRPLSEVESIISRNAFAIYLIHPFVINSLLLYIDLSKISPYITILLYFVIALIVSLGLALLYEKIKRFMNSKYPNNSNNSNNE